MLGKQHTDTEENLPLLPNYDSTTRISSRPRPLRRYFLLALAILILSALALFLTTILTYIISPSSPSLPDLPPPSAPGIGVSLSHHGASVAIRNSDGTITDVAEIEPSSEYILLLKRLSHPSARHPAPPYSSLSESYRDRPRQWRRTIRKRLGWPASSDVGIIAEILQECADAVEAVSRGIEINAALATMPNAMALYAEDVQDAFESIGWRALNGHNVYAVPRALPAAYVGYGFGLCDRPEDFEACVEQENGMPRRGIVIIEDGMGAVATDARGMSTPMYVFNDNYATLDWDAWNPSFEKMRENVAQDVRIAVESLVARSPGVEPGERIVDEVLVVGQVSHGLELSAIVKDEVARVQDKEATIWSNDTEWVVARGAAELAKRILIQRGRVM